MASRSRAHALVCFAFVSGCSAASAQWTTDTSANTPVAAGAGDQGTPLVAAGPAGSTWIEHTDNSGGSGYKYALQRLDADGNAVFPSSIVLSPTRTNTATFVHDMEVDGLGNAFVAYDNSGIWVQKVLPDGSTPWGASGVLMPGSGSSVGPRIGVFADGSSIVCWGSGVTLNFQRVLADGTLGTSFTLTETGRAQLPSDIITSSVTGEFTLLWVRAEGTNSVTSRKGLKLQRWSATNTQLWNAGAPIDVYASAASPSRGIQVGYFPALKPDGQDGVIISWYDTGASRNAWVQHVRADGSLVFAANGAPLSTVSSATELRLSASVTYHPAQQEYTVVYTTSNANQSQFGLKAQRIDQTSALRWGGGTGVVLAPLSAFQSSFASANSADDSSILTWLQYAGTNGPMGVRSARLDRDGNALWLPAQLEVATSDTNKGRLSVVNSTSGPWAVAVWGNGPTSNQDVRAMRINFDGTVGPVAGCDAIDFNGDGLFPDDSDLVDFLTVLAGGECSTGTCNDIDFNNDDLFPDDSDLVAFLTVLAGGDC